MDFRILELDKLRAACVRPVRAGPNSITVYQFLRVSGALSWDTATLGSKFACPLSSVRSDVPCTLRTGFSGGAGDTGRGPCYVSPAAKGRALAVLQIRLPKCFTALRCGISWARLNDGGSSPGPMGPRRWEQWTRLVFRTPMWSPKQAMKATERPLRWRMIPAKC